MKKTGPFFLIAWLSFQWVASGWMGIVVQDLAPSMAMRYGLSDHAGAFVARVQFGSPAMEAGLKEGDLIISLSGRKISDSKTLQQVLAQTPPGSRVGLVVIRNRQETALEITLGAPPRDAV